MCAGCVLRNAASSLRHFNLSFHCSCLHVRCCHRICQIFAAFTPASISFCSRSCVQLQRPVLVFPLQQLQLLISLLFRHHPHKISHRVSCSFLTCGPCQTTQPPKHSVCVSSLVSLSRRHSPYYSCVSAARSPLPLCYLTLWSSDSGLRRSSDSGLRSLRTTLRLSLVKKL